MTDSICPVCGRSFVEFTDHRTCAIELNARTDLPDTQALEQPTTSNECAFCGEAFSTNLTRARYCSEECRVAAQPATRFLILNRDGFRCAYCGKSAYGENAELHVDHIRPRGQGGEDVASNLITACQRCNIEKSTSILFNETQLLEEVVRRNAEHDIQPTTKIRMRNR